MGASSSSTPGEEDMRKQDDMKKQDDMNAVSATKPPIGNKHGHSSSGSFHSGHQQPARPASASIQIANRPQQKVNHSQPIKPYHPSTSEPIPQRQSKQAERRVKNGKTDSSIKHSSSMDSLEEPLATKARLASHSQENLSNAGNKKNAQSTTTKSSAKNTSTGDGSSLRRRPHSKEHDPKTSTPFAKPKAVKGVSGMRKASSTQSINKTGMSLSREIQTGPSVTMKRATSTQNVIKDKSAYGNNRTSAPVEVMTYNAELLANFEKEKKNYESRISELVQLAEGRKAEIEKNKIEIKRLREKISTHDVPEELELLRTENKLFQDRLKELGIPIEPITDSQKLLMKNITKPVSVSENCELPCSVSFDSLSVECNHSSITGDNLLENAGFVGPTEHALSIAYDDLCTDSNWDKQSNKSSDTMSEVALQNLTERILEMEETNYSTTEELQATLQELGDLQDAVNSLTDQNEGLAMERELLFQSLHTQTKKLQNCRTQNEQLKSLLIGTTTQNKSEREKTLEELLKSAQEEREELLCLQKELGNAVYVAENDNKELRASNVLLKEKTQQLDDKIKSLNIDKQNLEMKVTSLNESAMSEQIELNRFKNMFETEKSKVTELQEYAKAIEKSDIEELLHVARSEKDKTDLKLTNTQETLAHVQCEVSKLKDQLSRRDEELKVTKNNTKTQIDNYEFRFKSMEKEKDDLIKEIAALRDHIDQLDQDCDRYLEEKKSYENSIQEIKSELNLERQMHVMLQAQMKDQKVHHEEKNSEWDQFQKDLQLAVVVANDFRHEKDLEIEELKAEKQAVIEQNQQLLADLNVLKEESHRLKASKTLDLRPSKSLNIISPSEVTRRLPPSSPVEKELAALRDSRRLENKNQTFSVKNIIKTIEEHVKNSDIPTSPTVSLDDDSSRRSSVAAEIVKQEIQQAPITDTGKIIRRNTVASDTPPLKSVLKKTTPDRSPLQRHSSHITYEKNSNTIEKPTSTAPMAMSEDLPTVPSSIASILSRTSGTRRNSIVGDVERRDSTGVKDPLQVLVKQMGGSKRNALLKWCQQKTLAYRDVDITNFSSSWNDGLAFCAILHNYLPDKIPFSELNTEDKKHNFLLAFEAAESVGITSTLDISDMAAIERPDWQAVMAYVISIYKHFELDNSHASIG